MNVGDLFDNPWKIAIIAIVIIVLFGSKKLPQAARSLGQSMRILKREVEGLHEDEPASNASDAPSAFPVPLETARAQPDQQAQINALQQQVRDLQRADAMDAPPSSAPPGVSTDAQRTSQTR